MNHFIEKFLIPVSIIIVASLLVFILTKNLSNTILVGVVLAIAVIVFLIFYNKKVKIKIHCPISGKSIFRSVVISGSFKGDSGIYILVQPQPKDAKAETYGYYVQPLPHIINNSWECYASIGYPDKRDDNREFRIFALLTDKELEPYVNIQKIPDHKAIDEIIVKRLEYNGNQ